MPAWLIVFFASDMLIVTFRSSVHFSVGIKAAALFGGPAFVGWVCVDDVHPFRWIPIWHLVCFDIFSSFLGVSRCK